jgi:hypothetical protein
MCARCGADIASMNPKLRPCAALAAALAFFPCLAGAQSAPAEGFKLGGFGTLAATRGNLDETGFRNLATQEHGADRQGSVKADSRFGLRLDTRDADPFAFTLQGIVKEGAGNDVRAELDWAYVRYRFAEGTRLRVGRIRMPYYMRSDSLDVNYAQPWLRLPPDVYSLLVTQNVDGADLVYERPLGELTLTLQPAAGVSPRTEVGSGYRLRIKPAGISATLGTVDTMARVSLGGARMNLESDTLSAVLGALAAAGQDAIANDYRMDDGRLRYLNLGFHHEASRWFATAEMMRLRFDKETVPDTTGWYVGAGARHREFTFYAIASSLRTSGRRTEDRLPAELAPAKELLDFLLFDGYRDQDTLSAGVRWDIVPRGALKFQLDRVRVPAGARGNWSQPMPEGKNPFAYAVSFDFVF